MRQVVRGIFETEGYSDVDKLNLINQMVKKYGSEARFCSKKILAIYLRFSTLKKSYDVSIDTTEIFGYEELLQ
jgi:hypothetical protein